MPHETKTQSDSLAVSRLWLNMGRLAEALDQAQSSDDTAEIRRLARERIHELAALKSTAPLVRGRILQVLELVESQPSSALLTELAHATCMCRQLHPPSAGAVG